MSRVRSAFWHGVNRTVDAVVAEAVDGWRKSTFSNISGECVEFARGADGGVMIRDSKDPSGGVLAFTPGEWRAFVAGVRNAEFDV